MDYTSTDESRRRGKMSQQRQQSLKANGYGHQQEKNNGFASSAADSAFTYANVNGQHQQTSNNSRQFIIATIESYFSSAQIQATSTSAIQSKVDAFLNSGNSGSGRDEHQQKNKGSDTTTTTTNSPPLSALIVTLASSPNASSGVLDLKVVEKWPLTPSNLSFNYGSSHQQHHHQQTLVFLRIHQPSDERSAQQQQQTIIRWVTDDEAVEHLRPLLVTSEEGDLPNEKVYELYQQLERFTDRTAVLKALAAERSTFLQRLSDWSETLLEFDDDDKDEVDKGTDKDEEMGKEEEEDAAVYRNLAAVAHKVLTLKSREQLLKGVLANSAALFGDLPEAHSFRESLQQTAGMLSDEAGQLFVRWQTAASAITTDDLTRRCIVFEEANQLPKVTFSLALERVAADAARLRAHGYRVPAQMATVEAYVGRYIDLVRQLRAIVRFYCTVAEQILLSQRPLLIDKARAFTGLLESPTQQQLTWADGVEPIGEWIAQLKTFMASFSAANEQLRGRHRLILASVVPLADLPFSRWPPAIAQIRAHFEELEAVQHQRNNTLSWRKHWDYQLYKILEYAFRVLAVEEEKRARKGTPSSTFPPKELARQQQELLFFEEEEAEHTRELARTDAADGETGNQQIVGVYRSLNSSSNSNSNTIELQFNSAGYAAFEPPLEQLKASIFGALNRFISFPAHFTAFVDWGLDRRLNPSTRQSSVSGGGGGGGEANLDSGINLMDSLSEGSSSLSTSGGSKRTLFHNIYYRNAARFHLLYQKAVEAVEELISIRSRFAQWTALYQLIRKIKLEAYEGGGGGGGNGVNQESPATQSANSTSSTNSFNCRTLEQYQHNLSLVKDLDGRFHRQYYALNEIACRQSRLVVNILPLKMFIKWLLSETESTLLRLFREQTTREMEAMEAVCRDAAEKMAAKPTSIDELIALDRLVNETLPKTREALLVDSVTLKEKMHFYRSWSKENGGGNSGNGSWLKTDSTRQLLKEFEGSYAGRADLLNGYRESLEAKTLEQLKSTAAEAENFLKRWNNLSESLKRSPEVISDFQINCRQLMESVGQLSRGATYFGHPEPVSFAALTEISAEIDALHAKFHVLYEFEQGLAVYLEMEWIVCRNKLPKIAAYLAEWTEKTGEGDGTSSEATKTAGDNVLLKTHLEGWRKTLSLLELCRGDFYQAAHWNALLTLLGLEEEVRSYEELTLAHISGRREALSSNRSALLELNKRAFNDYSLRETLQELESFAQTGRFSLYPYTTKEGRTVMLIKDWSAVLNSISDCHLLVATVRSIESNAEPGTVSEEYKTAYHDWEEKLGRLESLMGLLNSVQRKWISLEPIYSGAGAGGAGAAGTGRRPSAMSGSSTARPPQTSAGTFFNDVHFSRFSNDFQEVMRTVEQQHNGLYVRLLGGGNFEGRLKAIDAAFAATQKKLRTFIEESRSRFPRFYFLADEDLLLILSGKVDLNSSALVKKLFVNTIGRLIYSSSSSSTVADKKQQQQTPSDGQYIEAIESVQGEVIHLRKRVKTDNSHGPLGIEGWLKTLDSEITTTLQAVFQEKLAEIRTLYSSPALWAAVPSQLLSVFAWIDFTEKVEDAVRKRTLNELKTDYERAVIKLTRRVDGEEEDFGERLLKEMIKESGGNEIAPDINNSHYKNSTIQLLAKLKVKQVVLDVVHFINVIEKLVEEGVRDLNHWQWQSQLRFYVRSATIEQSSSSTQRKKTFTSSQASFEGGKALPNVELQMGLASFEYTFQYLGALGEGKLVHTELTNKCFLTLTQAMDLGLGGNPFGPAGTGKTESVKALGQHFGRQVLVFNCDEAIDVRSMTRILVGLLQCGSWGCFDEFNRLQLDVLSVLSSQVVRIQRAIKGREATVRLEEYGEVALNASAALFITLNPAGKEYGGRNRIPDNLKSLFLPVAMTVPDSRAIVRFLLLAEGFSEQTAKALGEKVAVWFELASGSMSKQKHYDWGLRAIKACLEASGRRLHNYPSLVFVSEMAAKEMQLVVETLRQQIASKLVEEDVGKFDVLLEAAFGRQYLENKASSSRKRGETKKESKDGEDDEEEEKGENASFKLAVKKAAKELGLVIPGPYQMGKILQLHEQLQSRFGVVLIGPSGSGKTTIWKLLAKALEFEEQEKEDIDIEMETAKSTASKKISTVVIGPKALVPKSKLFGYIDEDTREWHDGLFSSKARAILRSSDAGETGTEGMTASSSAKTGRSSANSMVASSEKITPNTATSTMSWLIFDGDIDPDWVEALNSVLDDNRVLTLPSGERIDFDLGRTRILFETTSLTNASPATISRLGVVSVDSTPEVLFQVVSGWSQNCQLSAKGGAAYEEVPQKSSKRNSSTSVITTVNTFLRTNASTMLSPLSTTRTLLEHLRFAAANGEDENTALDRMAGRTSGSVSGPSYGGRTVNGRRRSIAYADDVESIEPRINNLVLTETMSRAVEMLRPLVQKVHDSNSSICLIGPSCSGKRTLVTEYLLTATATAHLVSIDCTPSTDALSLTRALLASGTVLNGTLRPLASSSSSSGSSADHFVVFVRHWELLQTDKWASNSLAALLVFIRRHGGFYHPDSFDWLTVERLQLIITSTEAASVDQRLLSSMHILQLNRPTTEEMAVVLAAKAAREISPKLISWFPRKYVQLLELLSRSASPASSQSEKADQQLLGNSKMKLGIDILRSFTHYEEHQLSEAAVDYELGRALKNYLVGQTDALRLLPEVTSSVGGTSNSSSSSLLFTSINGGAVFTEVDLDRFKTMATKWLQQYARENDLPSSVGQQIEWLPQTVQLFAELCSFLAESAAFTGGGAAAADGSLGVVTQQQQQSSSSFPLLEVQSLVVVGNRGLGRKTFARAVAHVFGYDKVWSPNGVTSERHLVAELKGLLSGDQVESGGGSSTADSTSAPLKILLLVDQIHLELLPYLQDRLYAMLYSSGADQNVSNNNSNSTALNSHSISVRLIITTSQLTPTDHLLWLRNARLHRSEPLSEGDFSRLTETLLTGALSGEKRLLESTKPILPLFYRVYCHFAVRDHQITETNPSAAGATDSLNQEGENSSNEQQHIKANLHLYGNFLQAYGNLLQAKLSSLGGEGDRLALGVTKLDQVASQVAVLKEEALKQKALLADKRAEADDAFAMIMNSMHASEEKRSELEEVQAKIEVETKNLKGRKAAIDEELAAIEPLLQAAKAAVGGIQASSLAEIRSLRAPPEVIRDVLEGVLRLMGVKDTSWVSMKTFLSRKGITEILNFDCRKITPETLAKVEQLLSSRADSFVPANAKRASQAAASLAEWVSANVEYTRVLLKIDPLEKELAKLENGLVRATSRLKTLNLQLEGVDTEVEALRTRMQAVTVEAATIEINLEKSSKVLEASEKLVGSLSGEHKRWAAKLKEIEADRVQQPAKCLLTAAYVTAAASEPSVSRRAELLMNCLKSFFNGGDTLPSITTDFRPAEYLGFASEEEAFIRGCHPRHHHPVPIIVDPAHKALGYFGANSFETTRPSAKDWLKVVELSIRFGRTVVITDWRPEVLDIRLLPLMFGGAVHGGGGGEANSSRLWALLGDRKVDYNPAFRLYLLTDSPLTSSSISSSASTTSPAISLCRVINLSPSFGSISTALLRAILTVKRPELEVERAKVETEVTSLKGQLTGLENELLESLNSTDNSTGGSILENVALMEKLQFLKTSSAAIERSLAASDQLRADLEREQQQYAAVAQFAANLYFSLAGLQRLCSMYYFGYLEFETVFRRTVSKLHATDKSGQLTNDAICYSIYRHISRALFAEHRRALWHYFLATFSADISERTIGNGGASSGSETESIGEFITDCLKFNNTLQKTPKQQQSKAATISESNIEPPEVALIFTAPGSDPTTEIESAVQSVDNGQLRIISMGNEVLGQVAGLLQAAGNAGGGGGQMDQFGGASRKSSTSSSNVVLCLANLHLVTGWLGHLGQLLSVSAAETGSSRPRSPFSLVVLITELNDHFPAALLERCTKFAYESVPGVRAHLKRLKVASAGLKPVQASITGANVIRPVSSTRTFEETTGSEQLFTLLEYFHAIVCERRFYQPFGWTKNYEFSFNEFRFARHLLAKLLGRKFINSSGRGASSTMEKQALLMDYIGGLFRDVIYGGKVDFVVDDTVLALILRRCFDPEEKFLVEQQKGSQATNEFTLLGLPLNADNKRVKTIDDRLRGHLQLLTAAASTTGNSSYSSTSAKKNSTSSSSSSSAVNTTTTTTRFSVEYFQKLWRKILVKCKVSPSRAGERLFADEDDVDETEHQQQFGGINGTNSSRRSSQTKLNTSSTTLSAVDYLHAANWRAFVGTFSRSQLDYAKTIMETIDFDLKESERKGLVNSSADNSSSSSSTDLDGQLRLNQPPSSWASLWPDGPEAAQDYLITLARIYIKLKAVEAVFASNNSSLLSNSGKQQLTFDLTACFHPRLFLSALRQFAARQLATCVDQLRTVYVWNEGSTNAQSDGNSQQSSAANASPADPRRRRSSVTSAAGLVGSSSAEEDETTLRMKLKLGESVKMTVATLSGISLEGALFAGDRLQPASTDSLFSGLMPSVNVVFVEEDKKNQKEGGGKSSTTTAVSVFSSLSATVPLPLYSNSRRQTLLSERIDVPCPPSTESCWPEMGVALVLGNWPN